MVIYFGRIDLTSTKMDTAYPKKMQIGLAVCEILHSTTFYMGLFYTKNDYNYLSQYLCASLSALNLARGTLRFDVS